MLHRPLSKWLTLAAVVALGAQHWRIEQRMDAIAAAIPRENLACVPQDPREIIATMTTPAFAEQVAESVQRRLKATTVPEATPSAPAVRPGPPPREVDPVADARAQATEQAFDAANDILEEAIEHRRWSRADVLAMRDQMALMKDTTVSDEVRRNVARAINTHQLQIEDPMFIFP